MRKELKSEAEIFRQKAEKLMKTRPLKTVLQLSESNSLRLIHELEVHQIELEMQNAELDLARSTAKIIADKYIEVYDFAPSGYFTLSKAGKIIEVNLSGANMLGKERLRLKNSQFSSCVSSQTRPIFNLFLDKVFNNNSKEPCELALSVKGNLPIYVYLIGIATENGEQCHMTMLDITAHKNAEEALIVSETRYRRLFESAKDGILILDAETGMITDVNPFLIELLDYSKEQFLGKAIWEIGFFKDVADNYDKFLELQQKKYVRYDDLPLETADGRKINVEFVSNVYFADKKKVIQCNIRDITRSKLTEKELIESKERAEESDRLKSTFLANMSHEVRTPLNSIIGFSELLADPDFEEDQKNEFIKIIITNGNNLLTIISDIMDISRMESGEITIRKCRINARKFVSGVKDQFSFQAEAKKLELKLSFTDTDDETVIVADSDRLMQIFNNLICNAIKFTANGFIEIGYQPKGKMVEFYMKDTGIGIPAEYHCKIFDRFRQVEDSKTRTYGGNGLGLSIARNLVELMGGKIWLESEPGKGSVFYFTLPAAIK